MYLQNCISTALVGGGLDRKSLHMEVENMDVNCSPVPRIQESSSKLLTVVHNLFIFKLFIHNHLFTHS